MDIRAMMTKVASQISIYFFLELKIPFLKSFIYGNCKKACHKVNSLENLALPSNIFLYPLLMDVTVLFWLQVKLTSFACTLSHAGTAVNHYLRFVHEETTASTNGIVFIGE